LISEKFMKFCFISGPINEIKDEKRRK